MESNPYESPASTGNLPRWDMAVVRRRILQLVGAVFALGLLAALMLPALRTARGPVRRAQCVNNLKQIALGLLNYESTFGELPPAYTVDANGRPLHSWRTLILPYIEQVSLHKQVDFSKPWDDPANQAAFEKPVPLYLCPSFGGEPNHTTYFAVVAPGSCLKATEGRKLPDITDGEDSTIMLIEVDAEHSVPWMCPTDADLDMIYSLASSETLSHEGLTTVVFVDGRANSLSVSTERKKLRAMISIAGNDDETLEED